MFMVKFQKNHTRRPKELDMAYVILAQENNQDAKGYIQ